MARHPRLIRRWRACFWQLCFLRWRGYAAASCLAGCLRHVCCCVLCRICPPPDCLAAPAWPPRPALAGGRPLQGVGVGNHVAANPGVHRAGVLPGLLAALSRCRHLGRRAAGRCAGGLERAGLLQPRAQSAPRRRPGDERICRPFSRQPGRLDDAVRGGPLHGGGDCRLCLCPPCGDSGWQRQARARPLLWH